MTMLTWSTMANSQWRIDKNDSLILLLEKNENASVKILIGMTYRHFQMKEVDIEGVKIQFKNMTMFTWSTTVKSQELVIWIKMKLVINSSIQYTFSGQKK